jgi:molybdopterin-guanine dinucleotide biosynthesis protein A
MDELSVSGAILAGGESRRMGKVNKAFVRIGETRLIDRTIGLLREIFPEVMVIANDPGLFSSLPIPIYRDLIAGSGPLGGIYSALLNSGSAYTFIVPCDMPFLSADLIRMMERWVDGSSDVIVPFLDGKWEPIHAIYSTRCAPRIRERLEQGSFKITGFYAGLTVRKITEEHIAALPFSNRIFFNINTREDVKKAERLIKESGKEEFF